MGKVLTSIVAGAALLASTALDSREILLPKSAPKIQYSAVSGYSPNNIINQGLPYGSAKENKWYDGLTGDRASFKSFVRSAYS